MYSTIKLIWPAELYASFASQLVQKNCYRTRITPLSLCLQCHPARDGQRGKCWCVDQKTGLRLPGPLELRGDLDCHQLIASLRDWRRGGRQWGCRTSWILLVLISRTIWLKDFILKPHSTWGQRYLSLCNKKETIELSSFAILFLCVQVCDTSLLSTCSVFFVSHEL